MNVLIKDTLHTIARFLAVKSRRRLLLLGILGIAALVEFCVLGLARRTFVFYAIDDGKITVEDRMLKRSPDREVDITRYVDEVLLGPVSPDLLPLFPRETRLQSLLYRAGVVYADFSEDAALPLLEGASFGQVNGQGVFENLQTLHAGIRRNFPFVRDVRFFIAGKAAYTETFRRLGEEAVSGY